MLDTEICVVGVDGRVGGQYSCGWGFS